MNEGDLALRLFLPRNENSPDITLDFLLPRNPLGGIVLQATYDDRTIRISNGRLDTERQGPLAGHVKARIAATLDSFKKMLYFSPFRTIAGAGDTMGQIEIGRNFVSKWGNFKNGDDRQESEAAFKLEEGIRSLLGFKSFVIDPAFNGDSLQVFINGKSYDISEVGTGVSQVILTLTHAAIHRPSYVLIDEPELNLHPSLQLDFVAMLGLLAEHGVIFSTHNIGLARAAANRIYSFRLNEEGESQVQLYEETPELAPFLGELSYSLRSELGCQRVLLVEGVTDVLTFRHFLRLYGQDHKTVILPLGGNNLINGKREHELVDVLRITDEVYCIIDSEMKSADDKVEKPRLKFKEICDEHKIECRILDRRATENYLTEKAIQEVKGEKYKPLGHFEKLSDANSSWDKRENWLIAQHMTKKDLEDTDLGDFLEQLAQSPGSAGS